MNSSTYKEKACWGFALCGCAMALTLPLYADTHNIASGETALSNITESSRTVKTGAGTLVLSGNNSLIGLQTSAGTLKINGGTTTITGGGGTSASNATFAQQGGTTIIEGGATVNVNGTGYSLSEGGDLMVTNGVFDLTGGSGTGKEFLNAFYVGSSSPSCKLIVQDEGVFKAGALRVSQTGTESLANKIGIVLNPGGKIYANTVWVDGNRVGTVKFNGGKLYATGTNPSYNIATTGVKTYVCEGGFHLVNNAGTFTINHPFLSGTGENEPDGGMHFISTKTIKLSSANSTFKGGTWLEGDMALQNISGSDGAFGAIPSSPTNNIFIKGNVTIFGGNGSDRYTLHRNRNIAIDAGKTVTIGANSSGTGFRIGGEINVPDGAGCATNTIVKFGGWDGLVVLDTGDGRTNRLDKVQVLNRLEIASGTTVVRSPSKGTGDSGPIYIAGNNSAYSDGEGRLTVSGGRLVIEGNRYFNANKYAHVVVNGGTISAMDDYAEYLNGLGGGPAKLTVENGGHFECFRIRVSQSNAANEINVNTGGVLRTAYLKMDSTGCSANINLNGGTIVAYESDTVSAADAATYRNRFIGDGSATWDNVVVRVLAGGARFDTDGHSPRINTPLVSGVAEGETDGGLTKLGEGTLTLVGANGYNGPTRLEGGTLTFNSARPDGDIEFPAAALTACTNSPLLWAKSIGSFRTGCGIRVTECETLDSESWTGEWHTVARFSEADVDSLPDIAFVKSDGTVVSTENSWNGWRFRIGADGRSLEFKGSRGTVLKIR